MHKFLRTMTAAAVAAAMAPAFAADATYNVDVVVVGAGAAGTAAGWAAAEKGLKVVTLEKQAMVGGTGKFSEGIFAVESSMQRNWNYGLTKDEAFQKIMNYGHWRGNAKMVRAFVDKSGETIDWMQANGVKFEKLFSNYPNGLYTWHIYEGRGAGWINLFQQKYKDAGQTLLLNTWGKELIQDKNGTVKGVVATNKNGDKITVNAKATIIATGGFFDNKEMREKYLRFPDADGLAQKGKTGDGIQMAWSAGGGKEGCEVQASYRPGPRGIGTTNHVSATAKQPHLWLTPRGERFCDEKIMLEWPFAGNALERIGGTMYVVYDQATLDHMEKDKGIDLGVGVMVPVGTKLTNFEKEWADAVKGGWAFKADTLEGLAKATGMDPKKHGNNDFANGDGDSETYAFTGYGSWLADNGMFVDVTGKVGRLKNSFDISTTLGTASGSYNTNAFSLSAEAGWRLHPLDNSLYVEPQVEMMYGRVLDADYTTSMGVAVEHEAVDTLIGRVGFVLGLKCPNNRGNTYVRASILHDWQGDAESTFTKGGQTKRISEELGDTWLEYGVGANFNATKNLHLYADLEATEGAKVETSYRFNLGARWSF